MTRLCNTYGPDVAKKLLDSFLGKRKLRLRDGKNTKFCANVDGRIIRQGIDEIRSNFKVIVE